MNHQTVVVLDFGSLDFADGGVFGDPVGGYAGGLRAGYGDRCCGGDLVGGGFIAVAASLGSNFAQGGGTEEVGFAWSGAAFGKV